MKIDDFRMGQGTWNMGETPAKEAQEVEALAAGIDMGLALIDTAEMYASGGAERVVGKVLRSYPREQVYVVSKVYPHNASPQKMRDACIDSLARMGTEYLDCYLLHWRGGIPLAETVRGFEALVEEGLIQSWGVSNFDVDDMEELWRIPKGNRCVTNQVLYNVAVRGVEYDLLPWMAAHGIPIMAYTPFVGGGDWQRRFGESPALVEVARRHKATVRQILLAFVMRLDDVMTIPKSSKVARIQENVGSLEIALTADDMALIDAAFPPPTRKVRLQTG